MPIWQSNQTQQFLAILCALLLLQPQGYAWQQAAGNNQQQQQQTLAPDQLDSLVAPIALYPDPILSQVLVASTYPLEIVEADRWLKQNSGLKAQDLTKAAAKQPWDASVQALVALPDVLKQLDTNIDWTTDLGNAFLAQQADVMQAVQRLRMKAKDSGKLQSTPQQTVTTTNEGGTNYVVIQPASPQVIYVPQYDPVAVWGAPPAYYPYPPIVYPPVSAGAVLAAGAISFGVGMAVGALWGGGGGWGWNAGWGHNNVVVNNTFINNNHFNRVNVNNNNVWSHNAAHRQGVPYANSNVGNRYNNANVNRVNRPTVNQTQQRLNQAEGNQFNRGNAGQGNAGQRGQAFGQGGSGQRNPSFGQGGTGQQPGNRDFGRGAGAGAGGSDRIGNRQVGGGNSGSGRNAFGDLGQGGGRAQMNANRGAASAGGGVRGGGAPRGGGGGGPRGGGRRR
jgi:hypothetical protein